MKNLIICLGVFLLINSCKKDEIVTKEGIFGKWNHSYFVQTKDQNGNWSDWVQINTLIALPTLEFTVSGKILWDGIQSEYCCTPRTFEIKSDNILTHKSGSKNCELISCLAYRDWIIEKITADTLEINQYYTKVRYLKAK